MLCFILCVVISALIYLIFKATFYWKNRGVKECGPLDLWKTSWDLIAQFKPGVEVLLSLQNRYPNARYIGLNMFFRNLLLVKDPDLIKQILIKEFDSFPDHFPFVSTETEPLWGQNLFLLQGERWKEMRATLSPTFTSSKMRGMFKLFQECADQFIEYLQEKGSNKIDIELKDTFTRFTNDVIASAAFGISCNSFKYPKNEFYIMGKEATNFSGFWKGVSFLLLSITPKLAKILGVKFISKQIDSFFRNIVRTTVETREKEGIVRPDMIHLLMEARKGRLKYENDADLDSSFAVMEESSIGKDDRNRKIKLTNDVLTAQALLFFFAGFESVSNVMCFTMHELAVNSDIQQRLQKEVDETLQLCNGVITYEALLKMKYLDMVLSETLRKWPSIGLTDRICTKTFTIAPVHKDEESIRLLKGDVLAFPIYSMHHDPQFYANPDRYDPERFSDENKLSIKPGSYLPFGLGPRSCIGIRFGLLETKLLIVQLLAKFNVVVISKTQVPLKLKPNSFSLSVDKGFWVGFENRGN